MKYGLIGEKLGHSFSKEIHEKLGLYEYTLKEIAKDELDTFFETKDFKAINVTIPYKEKCMKHLDFIDEKAQKIGSVNTVINKNGILYGYNTDYDGMMALFLKSKVDIKDKKALVLGSGGTCKTALAVLKDLGAKEIYIVSREKREKTITYDEAYKNCNDADIIVNTTPVGMYPDTLSSPIDISKFNNLSLVIDAIYNPLYTTLLTDAQKKGVKIVGGLYMLCIQGVKASEKFLDTTYDKAITDKLYDQILTEKTNICLIGMPSSGKTTIGKRLTGLTGRELIDTDNFIEEKEKMTIKEIFEKLGEEHFRKLETLAIKEISKMTNVIISTGGGVVLNEENIKYLNKNSKIYFLDRPLGDLISTPDRPLSSGKEAIKKLYEVRYPLYLKYAHEIIKANTTIDEISYTIIKKHKKVSED